MSFREDITALVEANAYGALASGEGWPRVPLGEVARVINGFAFQSKYFSPDAGTPLVRIRDVVKGSSNTRYSGPVPDGYAVENGDLLVGMDGDFNSAYWQGGTALLNQRVCKIVPDETLLRTKFLGYALPAYLKLINDHTSSVTVKHLSSRTLQALPIPLPALQAQDAIVARLDELFDEIASGEGAMTRAHRRLSTYRKSLLKAAVTGDLTADWRGSHAPKTDQELLCRLVGLRAEQGEGRRKSKGADVAIANGPRTDLPHLPETWTWALLPQLGDFGRGKSKHRPRNDPRLYGGRYPFIQTGIVAGCAGVIDTYDQTYSELGLQQSKLWPAGTVCITIAANIAMTGVLAFDACFPDSLVGLTCFEGVRPEYVELFIRTVQQELERYAPATAQKNINLETLYQLAVPLPPTAEQDAIIEIAQQDTGLDNLFGDELDGAAETLRQTIIAAAFRGELVP